jgi:hypothetical protein
VVIEHVQRKRRDQEENMDYDKMKALTEASREKSAGQRDPESKEFPKPDSGPDWKYLGYVSTERMAA